MQDKNGLRTKLGLIGCIIMVVFGWFMYFKFYSEIKNPLSFMLALGLFTVFVVLVAIKIFTSSKSIAEQQTEIDKKMEGSVVGRAVSAGVNSWNIDIEVFKVIFKKPLLVVPFAISTILIALVIYVPLQSGSIGRLLGVMYNAGINNAIIFPIIILVYSFVSIFIYVLGYITLGYLLRRKYLDIRENYITVLYLDSSGCLVFGSCYL